MIIINLIIDKSRLCYKITIKYWQNVPILNYTRIKPRSRPPQKKKKIRIFYAPRFFSDQNKKSAQITRANTVYNLGLISRYSDYDPNNWFSILGNNNSSRESPSCSGEKRRAFAILYRENILGLVTARPRLGQLNPSNRQINNSRLFTPIHFLRVQRLQL
jgi:hypothetical protein